MKRIYSKLLCGLVLTAAYVVGASAQGTKAVVLISIDGTQRQEVLSNVDRIELGAASLTLKTTGGGSETLDYKDIDRVLIGAEYSAVKEIANPDEIAVWPTVTYDVINVLGATEGNEVSVVSLNGSLISKFKVTDRVTTVDLGNHPAGVYVVTVNKQSVKIIKK